jgi:hypothetical protein
VAPEDYVIQLRSVDAKSGSVSPAVAAAVMVAGCIAQKAAILQRQGRRAAARSPSQRHLVQPQQQLQFIEIPRSSSCCSSVDGMIEGGAGGDSGGGGGGSRTSYAGHVANTAGGSRGGGRSLARPTSAPSQSRPAYSPVQQVREAAAHPGWHSNTRSKEGRIALLQD